MAVPASLYIAATLYMGFRASLERMARAPGVFWQFDRRTYSEVGRRWHTRSMWMFAGFVPWILLLAFIASRVCRDWAS